MSQTFGSGVRLRSRGEFVAVQEQGRRVSTRFMILLGQPNTLTCDRLGIIASRKFGGAVARNRAKRRLRELFRRQLPAAAAARGDRPFDVVAIPRRDLLSAPLAVVETDFHAALRKLRGSRVS